MSLSEDDKKWIKENNFELIRLMSTEFGKILKEGLDPIKADIAAMMKILVPHRDKTLLDKYLDLERRVIALEHRYR